MKILVVYNSSTGFTKQYAAWISGELGCPYMDIKRASQAIIHSYDCIIYGGWVMGGLITGLDKIRKKNLKQLIVFAVGATPRSESLELIIKEQNHLNEHPFFYMVGGFHFEKLGFLKRIMLKMMKKSVAKKEDKTAQDIYMEQILGTSFDHSDIAYLTPLVTYMKNIRD